MQALLRLIARAPGSLILACAFLQPMAHGAKACELVHARTLIGDARMATDRKLPILLFFNQAGCGFCERARREYLRAVRIFGFYSAPVDMRQSSDVHQRVVSEMLAMAGTSDAYATLNRGSAHRAARGRAGTAAPAAPPSRRQYR